MHGVITVRTILTLEFLDAASAMPDRESVLVCPLWLFAELNLARSPGILVGEMRFLFTCLLHL